MCVRGHFLAHARFLGRARLKFIRACVVGAYKPRAILSSLQCVCRILEVQQEIQEREIMSKVLGLAFLVIDLAAGCNGESRIAAADNNGVEYAAVLDKEHTNSFSLAHRLLLQLSVRVRQRTVRVQFFPLQPNQQLR